MLDYQIELSMNNEEDEDEREILILGSRSGLMGSSGATLSVIARPGGENHPTGALVEWLRGLFVTQTDYDIDPAFTPKQQQMIQMALQGLANHPVYGPAMAALAAKGADINIIADFRGDNTGTELGRTVGRNPDGTVDQGESITIYINMNPGGQPVTDISFAETMIHELIHSLGVPAFDTAIDAPGAGIDRQVRNEIFSGYDWNSPAPNGPTAALVRDTFDTGGILTGNSEFEIFSGSAFADQINPGSGGSQIYSGDGNDVISLTIDGHVDEVFDSSGIDTLVLPSSTALSSVSLRWSSDLTDMVLMVGGNVEAIINSVSSGGSIEYISINGTNYGLSAFATPVNSVPASGVIDTVVYDSFYGGGIASALVADGNGDSLSFRMIGIRGDSADQLWSVNGATGLISAHFSRPTGAGYSWVDLAVSDGIDMSFVTVAIRWAVSGGFEPPIEYARPIDVDSFLTLGALQQSHVQALTPLDIPLSYV